MRPPPAGFLRACPLVLFTRYHPLHAKSKSLLRSPFPGKIHHRQHKHQNKSPHHNHANETSLTTTPSPTDAAIRGPETPRRAFQVKLVDLPDNTLRPPTWIQTTAVLMQSTALQKPTTKRARETDWPRGAQQRDRSWQEPAPSTLHQRQQMYDCCGLTFPWGVRGRNDSLLKKIPAIFAGLRSALLSTLSDHARPLCR